MDKMECSDRLVLTFYIEYLQIYHNDMKIILVTVSFFFNVNPLDSC